MSPSLSPLQEIAQPILIRKLAVLVVFATSLIEPIFAFIAKQQQHIDESDLCRINHGDRRTMIDLCLT